MALVTGPLHHPVLYKDAKYVDLKKYVPVLQLWVGALFEKLSSFSVFT